MLPRNYLLVREIVYYGPHKIIMELNECKCFRAIAILQNKTRQVLSAKGTNRKGGLGACSPPPPPRKFWNLEAQKCSCKHFLWYFSSEKSILGKCRSSLFYWCQVKEHLHFKAFEKPLLTVHMKWINLIKMLFPSIHPPYISWFYLNQSNFF